MFKGERTITLRRDRPRKRAEVRRALRAQRRRSTPEAAERCSRRCAPSAPRLAKQQGVPPYVVFHDTTLRAMATERPQTLSAMRQLPGMGESKLERYGAAFLAALQDAGTGAET